MSDRTAPDFDDLVGDVPPEERDRLARVHALLVEAGPPPELSPGLTETPRPQAEVIGFPRRYRWAALGVAAALALGLLGAGYAIGRGSQPETSFTVPMTGAGGASAEIDVLAADAAGNWPMNLTVRGLPPLDAHRRYELWLTRKGRLVEACGAFVVAPGETEVPLNAPYVLRDYDGWVVVVGGTTTPVLRTATI
jgi:hypothetical protein